MGLTELAFEASILSLGKLYINYWHIMLQSCRFWWDCWFLLFCFKAAQASDMMSHVEHLSLFANLKLKSFNTMQVLGNIPTNCISVETQWSFSCKFMSEIVLWNICIL